MAQTAQRASGEDTASAEPTGPTLDVFPANVVIRGVESGVLPGIGAVGSLWQAWRAHRRGDAGRARSRFLLAVLFTAMAVLPWWPEPTSDVARVI